MIVEVAVLPQVLKDVERKTCIVIDVLRASTTMVTMLERGTAKIRLAGSIEDAREAFEGLPAALLCGERGGLAPQGFHYGNSPFEYCSADLDSREVIFATSNGTKALSIVRSAASTMVGCFRNASVVVEAALASGRDIAIVCAGRALGSSYGLDDVVCAGYMIGLIMAKVEVANGSAPDADFAQLISGGEFETDYWYIDESAVAAYRLYSSYRGDIIAAFRDSGNGKGLVQLGLEYDLSYCAQVDTSKVIPVLRQVEDSLEVVKRSEEV